METAALTAAVAMAAADAAPELVILSRNESVGSSFFFVSSKVDAAKRLCVRQGTTLGANADVLPTNNKGSVVAMELILILGPILLPQS
jgi:hypothetical protein